MLGLAAVAWAGTVLTRPERSEIPLLTVDDLRQVAAVRTVNARPPSLFIEMSGPIWAEMTEPERLAALESIGRIAGSAGYSGVHARTSDGIIVGEWLEHGGASLYRTPPGET